MCALMCGHYCLEHTMHWLAKLVCTGANLSMVCVYPHRYGLSHVYFTQEKYSELSLFRSPMGLPQVAGISRWPHFRVPRDTRGYI